MTERLRNMASVYITKGEQILLLYRQGSRVINDAWVGSAGGHMEDWELNDPKACVLRELKEETGLTEDSLHALQMRYVTLRRINGEIRQNYYFFAELNDAVPVHFSTEGTLKWFALSDITELEMPFTARYMIDHYLHTGRFDRALYGGIANQHGVFFIEM